MTAFLRRLLMLPALLPTLGRWLAEQSWALIPAGLLLGAVALDGWGSLLSPGLQTGLWVLEAVAAALALYFGCQQFAGPVFIYDLVRLARRGRHTLLRAIYALLLLGILYIVYAAWFARLGFSADEIFQRNVLPLKEVAQFGEAFFLQFLGMQFLLILLLTPVYTASAITEEKERRTLEYLLATDLSSREIVLGKLASRLASLSLLVLTGLPILSLTQFFGGVDEELLLIGFAYTLLTMASLGSLSIYVSTRTERTLDAVFWTYVYIGLYLVLCAVVPVVNWGNPGYVAFELARLTGMPAGDILLDMLGNYALFHGVATLLFCRRALVWLRPKEVRVLPILAARRGWFPGVEFPPRRRRPKIGSWPLFWKEVHVEPQIGSQRFGAYLVYFFLVLSWLLVAFGLTYIWLRWGSDSFLDDHPNFRALRTYTNEYLRPVIATLASILLVLIALVAAGSITRERNQQTLESLLTTPVAVDHLLLAKWFGAMLSVRSAAWSLAALLLLGLLTGGLHYLAVPLLMLTFLAQAAFLAGLGLLFSIHSRSTLRATILTLGTVVVVIGMGPVVLGVIVEGYATRRYGPEIAACLSQFLEISLTPYQSLYTLALAHGDWLRGPAAAVSEQRSALLAPLIYAAAAWFVWLLARQRFRHATGREPFARPAAGLGKPQPDALLPRPVADAV